MDAGATQQRSHLATTILTGPLAEGLTRFDVCVTGNAGADVRIAASGTTVPAGAA